MNNVYIISGVILIAVFLIFLFGYLKYKKIDISSFFDVALKIVSGVEQLYLSGQLSAADRKNTAVKGLTDFLATKGIKVSDTLVNVISLIVEWAVKESDSADINAKIDKLVQEKITSLQSVNSSLQQQISKLSIENSQLKEKVTIVQNAIEPKPAQK